MERIREMDRYQKGVLLLLGVMAVVFGVIYATASSRMGYLYHGAILQPSEVNGSTVYSGRISGEDCAFTVTADKGVTFRWGETVYGPYTVKEDPTAVPEEDGLSGRMTGVEIKEGDTVLFRGGVFWVDDFLMLTDEDGAPAGFSITATMSDGTVVDANGQVIDPMEPTAANIWALSEGPELTKRGDWLAWIAGVVISIATAVSMLFADELFRWNLAFQIRNAEYAEPSEWEIAGRYIGWTMFAAMALAFYIMGLQV